MLAEQMKTIAEERGIGIETCTAILEEAESIAIDAIKRGIKVIISRSGMAFLLKQKCHIPVVDTKLTSSSYINAFEKIRMVNGPVAFFSIDKIQDNVRSLCYFLHVDANYYYFKDTEGAQAAVKQAIKDGNIFGVGGVLTKKFAEKLQLDYYTLENTREDIETALDTAQQILQSVFSVLQNGNKELDELMKIGNVIINTNRVPIIVDGEIEGVVATFRDI